MHICINTIEKSMQTARSDKNTDSCPKTFNKSVTGYNSATQVKYYKKRKLEKIILFNAIPKTFKRRKIYSRW